MIKTTSLETSKALKEAGFRQDTSFARDITGSITANPGNILNDYWCAAPTSDELLEELPFYLVQYGELTLKKNHLPRPPHTGYHCLYQKTVNNKKYFESICADTASECLAKLWLYLNQQGLLTEKEK